MDIYFIKNRYHLKKIDKNFLSIPTKPQLTSILEYDPRIKLYKSPKRISDENLVNSRTEKKNSQNSLNQWEHLKIEEDLFYKEINCSKNNNCDENEVSEIFEYLNEFCDSPKNCVEDKNNTVFHSNEPGVENPWDPKPKVDTLENSRKKLQSILQKQNIETPKNEDKSPIKCTLVKIEKCLNLENGKKNAMTNEIIEIIKDKTKNTDAPSFVEIAPVVPNIFPDPDELVMPLSIPKPRESSFDRELRRLKEELDIARKNEILDDGRVFSKSTSRDRNISRDSFSYKNKSKRKSRSRSRSLSPLKRKKSYQDRINSKDGRIDLRQKSSSLSKSKYEKYHRRNKRSRSISRHRSRSFSRHRSRSLSRQRSSSFTRHRSRSFSRHKSRSLSRHRSRSFSRSRSRSISKPRSISKRFSKSKSTSKIKSHVRKRSNSIEKWNSHSHKPEKSPSFKYYEYDTDTIIDDEEYFQQTYGITSKKKKRKAQAQDVFCDVCSIFVNTLKQYELHIESNKHKKKEKLKQALANNNKQEILQQIKQEVFEQSNQQNSSYVSNLVCEVCQMYKFSTIDNFNAHMMSQKHKKNLVESMNSLSKVKLEEEEEEEYEEIQRNLETFSKKITEKEKIQIEVKKGNAVSLVCTLCDVNSTSEVQYKYHLNSKRHLKNVAKLGSQ